MDVPPLPAGLALVALVAAGAGLVAWNRARRRSDGRAAPTQPANSQPLTPMAAPAHHAAAEAAIERARAAAAAKAAAAEGAAPAAAEPAAAGVARAPSLASVAGAASAAAAPGLAPAARFDGPDWAATEPMHGIAADPGFPDTMPAELNLAAPHPDAASFAATNFAATNFAATNFAETMPADLAPAPAAPPGRR